jgi:hypothetical protein
LPPDKKEIILEEQLAPRRLFQCSPARKSPANTGTVDVQAFKGKSERGQGQPFWSTSPPARNGKANSSRSSDDIHPIHLHRHSFELTKIAGQPTSGVNKDVVMVGGYQEAEIDFVANNPGLTLFHCHQQLHMDFGFMTLFDYV